MDWAQIITTIATAGVAGASSGYFAPYFAWWVEQKRETKSCRRQLVSEWRNELLDEGKYVGGQSNKDDIATVSFGSGQLSSQMVAAKLPRLASFASIKPHLSQEFLETIKKHQSVKSLVLEASGSPFRTISPIISKLTDEIARIERNWRLI